MYKLLTTTAVILAVATPSLANDWTGGAQLTQDLETIYNSLDGETQFGTLQGDGSGNDGQLTNFFSEVSQGVTHITLNVDGNNNISTGIHKGSTFLEIEAKKDDLVNRVNYDLFVDTDGANYVAATNYTGIKPAGLIIDGNPGSGSDSTNDYTGNHDTGLAGVKISGLVEDVNTVNSYLIDSKRTKTQSEAFITEWEAGTGNSSGVEVGTINSTINDLNIAINTASNDGGFFDAVDGGTFTEANVNDFIIPAFTDYNSIGAPTVTQGFGSISDWANGIETVTAGADQYRYTGTGEVTSDGTTISIDGNPVTDLANTAGLTKIN